MLSLSKIKQAIIKPIAFLVTKILIAATLFINTNK